MDEVLLPSKESALINVCQHSVIFMFIQAGVEHTATLCKLKSLVLIRYQI